jgi:NAD-dependent dihydropyrimidine dehydrogenase PreA subunit
MAHLTGKGGYNLLVDRLNRFPQGAPESESLYDILKVMFSDEEARLVSMLPIKPFTVEKAMKIWKKSYDEAFEILENLASRAILLDMLNEKKQMYVLPPPMIGFFEFALMRTGGVYDQKLLSELFHVYLEKEDDFMRHIMSYTTPVGRILVNEETVKEKDMPYVLDYEKATSIIMKAENIGVSLCYCRHEAEHLGTVCDAPQEVCLTVNKGALALAKHGYSKMITKEEALAILKQSYDNNLVQFAENVQNDVGFICNCCACCCNALKGARRMGVPNALASSNFVPNICENCTGCGKCLKTCPVDALHLVSAHSTKKPNQRVVTLNEEICLGCGVCNRVCPNDAIAMERREKRVVTPVNTVHKLVIQAIETDRLQHLIFDNHAMANHRFMAAFIGSILKLPLSKRILVSETFQSKFLLKVIQNYNL